jgi:putative transposase
MYKTVEVKLTPNKGTERDLRACAGIRLHSSETIFEDDIVTINGVGTVPYNGPSVIPTTYDSVKVIRRGGRWYLDLFVPARVRALPETRKSVGVDFGVRNLVYTSDGKYVRPHSDIPMIDKRIKKLLNKLDRKDIDSTRYRETLRRIESNQKKLRGIQIDQANKIADALVRNNGLICLEAVNVKGKGIQHHELYKQASERANWQMLIDIIVLRAFETGREVVLVPPFFTSQECSSCRLYVPKSLEDRVHHCPHCGHRISRDRNAAEVIRKRGIDIHNGSRRTDWRPKGHPQWVDQD